MIQPTPDEILAVLDEFDGRKDIFRVRDVENAIRKALDREKVPPERRSGWWAEWAAFAFHTQAQSARVGPWKGYFQPVIEFAREDGSMFVSPDLKEASADVVGHWEDRARAAKHPVLAARYADVLWDLKATITGKKPSIDFVRIAIDSYLAAVVRDPGDAWGESRDNLERALKLARAVRDDARTVAAIRTMLEYVDRTAKVAQIGTYTYVFDDLLLTPSRGPQPTAEQERSIVERFEAALATLGPDRSVSPYSVKEVGDRLVTFYRRGTRADDANRVLAAVARAFEDRAHAGSALLGVHHHEVARFIFIEASLRDDATRVQRAAREMAPRAHEEMSPVVFEFRIGDDERERFLEKLRGPELLGAVERLVWGMVRPQEDLKANVADLDRRYPLQAMFKPLLVGRDGVRANVPDDCGDPDGPMAFETARFLALLGPWLNWGFAELQRQGLSGKSVLDILARSPAFEADRFGLIARGVGGHFNADYVLSTHVLIPQVERGLVNLIHLLGGASTKQHRGGRAVLQAKSLNDALDDEGVSRLLGADLRMHLVAVLSHPKGMNIRNEVCHGLWTETAFTSSVSAWTLHALLAVALVRVGAAPGPSKG